MAPPSFTSAFLAKSRPKETLRQHTDRLLQNFEELLHFYGRHFTEAERRLIRLAAEYHDYGKTNYAFTRRIFLSAEEPFQTDKEQEFLYATLKEVPHGYLSPAFLPFNELCDQSRPRGDVKRELFALVNAIFFHHAREERTDAEICHVLDKDLKPRLEKLYPDRRLDNRYLSLCMGRGSGKLPSREEWELYALVKGTLNRLDYVASSETCEGREETRLVMEYPPLQNGLGLGAIVERKLTSLYGGLRDVQRYMKAHSEENLVVVASTGIGKTEAACLWAGSDKLFYTLPLKVSIDAIYKRLHGSGEGEYGYENATLLHSDSLSYLLREEAEGEDGSAEGKPFLKHRRSRMFAYPLTVCTVDQLFTFTARYLGCEIIPAVLKYSRIVIDEVQAYSPDVAARLIHGLKIVSEMGGKFAIMTATLPPVLEHVMKEEGIPYTRSEPFYSPTDHRHLPSFHPGDFDCDKILADGREKKTLVICNTVNRACMVYRQLQEESGGFFPVRLLHSRFQRRHRALLESDIMEFAQGSAPGIWVSTQIVEASLDIDFDVLYTEMCPADALLQRMGRCYRKRNYEGTEPNILIFDTRSGRGTVYNSELYDLSVSALLEMNFCGRLLDERDKNAYVEKVYSLENLKGTKYYKDLTDTLSLMEHILPAALSQEEAIKKFRDIVNDNVIDEATFNCLLNDGTLDRLRTDINSKEKKTHQKALDELMAFTIPVHPRYFQIRHDREPILFSNPQKGGKRGFHPEIYRIPAQYEFDEDTRLGRGLLPERCENMQVL